jgi:hypothetical protein
VTGPGQPPPPGWYPDPDGAPGTVRWWNGEGWSDLTTRAAPGVAVQASPFLAPPVPGPSAPDPAPPPEDPPFGGRAPSGSRVGWLLGLSALVIVAVFAALLTGRSGGEGAAAAPSASSSAQPSPGPSAPARPTFPPGTVRIIDEQAGISYPYLGQGWLEFNLRPQDELTATSGQYFTTQEGTPDGGIFIAQCTSGPVADGYGWTGPESLQPTMAAIGDSVRGNYYPRPNERTVLRDEDRTVDGHPARLLEFQLSWDVPGYTASGERAALLLIDVGRPAPALLYISIPNTHAELYGVIDRVLDGVQVL